jgi:splicing factor 3B subunit 1
MSEKKKNIPSYTGAEDLIEEMKHSGPAEDFLDDNKKLNIYESQDKYRQQRVMQEMSPERIDYFDKNRKGKDGARTYQDIQAERNLDNQTEETMSKIKRVKRDESDGVGSNFDDLRRGGSVKVKTVKPPPPPKNWDELDVKDKKSTTTSVGSTPSGKTPSKWDTPKRAGAGATPTRSKWEMTPSGATPMRGNRFGETPTPGGFNRGGYMGETPTPGRIIMTPSGSIKSRWDQKPVDTPIRGDNSQSGFASTPSSSTILSQSLPYWARGMQDDRNATLTDADLDKILPKDGYEIINPPESYKPIRTPDRKLQATPMHHSSGQSAYQVPTDTGKPYELASMTPIEGRDGLPYIK